MRLVLDAAGLSLLLYDIIMIPLVFLVLPPEADTGIVMPLVANLFWTGDIVLTFMTVVIINGEIKEEWADIARQYARTWFLPDLLMVLPEWVWLAMSSRRGGFALLRLLKSVRALRLLRVVKFGHIMREQLKRLNSESLMHAVSLLLLIFAFLMLTHVVACGWYFIGRTTGDGWFEDRAVVEAESVGAVYWLALHWSVTQFHGNMEVAPGNTSERIFAVVTLVLGMIIFSVVVSASTDLIFQLRQARQSVHSQKMRLNSYFARHSVSVKLMLSVKGHVHFLGKDQEREDDKVMKGLPVQLARALLLEVRPPIVELHSFFAWMRMKHLNVFHDICCSALVSIAALHGHAVFAGMEACSSMYFVESGCLRYLPMTSSSPRSAPRASIGPDSSFVRRLARFKHGIELAKKRWVCELAIWVQGWRTHGELISLNHSVMLRLESTCLGKVINAFPEVHFDVALYAHAALQEFRQCEGEQVADLWELFHNVDTARPTGFFDNLSSSV